MSGDALSAPGSSTYDSSTMFVGDGTWDATRNSFLLPNLQGLNFDTMRYNGMGNRFRDLPQYHTLIIGHGVMAAITFMGVVPAAIFIARYYHSGGRLAYKLHVYLQILTVFLATVVLVLGWFAVGPERSLTNPHHGIGVAIYTCVLVQFLYGWLMSKRERKRTTPHPTIPLKVHIHRLFGRAIAILAFVQIALGLTLYGSPKYLFVLYALVGAVLLFLYLALEYRNKPRIGDGVAQSGARSDYYSDYSGSYLTGDRTELTQDRRSHRRSGTHDDEKHSGGWAKKALAGAGLFGAYKWWSGRREKRQEDGDQYSDYTESNVERRHRPPRTPGPVDSSVTASALTPYRPPGRTPSRPPPPASYAGHNRPPSRGSGRARRHDDTVLSPQTWENDEYEEDEKYVNTPPKDNTWRNRLLGAGAGVAAFQGVQSLFGSGKKRKDDYVNSEASYRPPHNASHNVVSQTDVSRVEAGQAPFSPNDPRRGQGAQYSDMTQMTPSRPPGRRRPSASSLSYDDETSYAPPPRVDSDGPNLRDSIATMGAIAGFREWNKRRKGRNEKQKQDRLRQDQLESEEQYNRRNSNRYPRPQDANGRRASHSDTLMTGPEHGPQSNPAISRQSFRPDLSQPPLPLAAGAVPLSPHGPDRFGVPPQQHQQQQQQQQQTFVLPPPPPGPPPNDGMRPVNYQPPPPGSLQMPQGAINPDPSRLVTQQTNATSQMQDGTFAAATTAAMGGAALAASQRPQSLSPTRRQHSRTDSRSRLPGRRGSTTSAGLSQPSALGGAQGVESPPVSLKMKMHPDGQHVTLRRLNEEEAAAERAARRRERRSRRASSLSSADEGPSRYRRNGGGGGGAGMRDSSQQPITNIPVPPPAMSNSAIGSHRPPSELNLPSPPAHRILPSSESPSGMPPAAGPGGSGLVGSPGAAGGGTDLGTGTDVSAFDNNRRRRRAERARRLEASKGNNRVEFS